MAVVQNMDFDFELCEKCDGKGYEIVKYGHKAIIDCKKCEGAGIKKSK